MAYEEKELQKIEIWLEGSLPGTTASHAGPDWSMAAPVNLLHHDGR